MEDGVGRREFCTLSAKQGWAAVLVLVGLPQYNTYHPVRHVDFVSFLGHVKAARRADVDQSLKKIKKSTYLT